jgi:plastocyanin
MTRIAPLSLALACAALAAAGCGSSNSKSTTSSQPAAPASNGGTAAPGGGATIKMQNITFNPKTKTVKVGQKVTWTNEDDVPHNVTTTGGAAKFASKDFGKGGTYSFTPTKPGTIQYTCTLHPGMDATLTVTK